MILKTTFFCCTIDFSIVYGNLFTEFKIKTKVSMNTLYSHVITGKILSAALLSMTSLVAAQIHNPEKETVIEAVKIVRQIPKDSLSKKIISSSLQPNG